jgi:hypothetical protein
MKFSPFDLIGGWDFLFLLLGMLIKLYYVLNAKVIELGKEEFSIFKYFDFRHCVRWFGHVVVSITALLTIPQFFVSYLGPKYMDGFALWTGFGSALLGFFGLDILKILEKLSFKIFGNIVKSDNES